MKKLLLLHFVILSLTATVMHAQPTNLLSKDTGYMKAAEVAFLGTRFKGLDPGYILNEGSRLEKAPIGSTIMLTHIDDQGNFTTIPHAVQAGEQVWRCTYNGQIWAAQSPTLGFVLAYQDQPSNSSNQANNANTANTQNQAPTQLSYADSLEEVAKNKQAENDVREEELRTKQIKIAKRRAGQQGSGSGFWRTTATVLSNVAVNYGDRSYNNRSYTYNDHANVYGYSGQDMRYVSNGMLKANGRRP